MIDRILLLPKGHFFDTVWKALCAPFHPSHDTIPNKAPISYFALLEWMGEEKV